MANKIRLGRATKARIETIKETLSNYELVYSLDTQELGVKNSDGTVTYFGVVTELEWANILNKPTFAAVATSGAYADLTGKPDLDLKLDKNFSALPAQTNPLMTDVLVLNRGTTVQKVTLGSLLSQVDTEIFVVVSELPATGKANKIYLVPHTVAAGGKQNEYEEYTWVNNKWENIGKFNIDLSNYYNKIQIDGMLGSYVLKEAGKGLSANDYTNTDKQSVEKIPTIEQDILDLESDKVDKVSGMGLSSNDFTTTEKNKLSGIQDGAQVNAVTTVAGRTGAVVLTKADVGLGNVQNYGISSQAQAIAGTVNTVYMTPLRTKEAITAAMGDIESALDAILGV